MSFIKLVSLLQFSLNEEKSDDNDKKNKNTTKLFFSFPRAALWEWASLEPSTPPSLTNFK